MRPEDRRGKLAALCQRFGIEILYAFGSRAQEVLEWALGQRERLTPGSSDVDIGAKPAAQAAFGLHEQVEFALALEELLEIPRVDVVSLREADPFLAANIIRGARLYAKDADLADEYELYVLRRAGDLVPLENERLNLILKGGKVV